jgi:hypothetical protein
MPRKYRDSRTILDSYFLHRSSALEAEGESKNNTAIKKAPENKYRE